MSHLGCCACMSPTQTVYNHLNTSNAARGMEACRPLRSILREEACALQVLLVTELMQGGDLRSSIRSDSHTPRKTGWYQNGRYLALGIARGLTYLHSRNVIWFDCKPNNVLLDHTGTVAKIADFGLAKVLAATYTVGCLVGRIPGLSPIIACGRAYA